MDRRDFVSTALATAATAVTASSAPTLATSTHHRYLRADASEGGAIPEKLVAIGRDGQALSLARPDVEAFAASLRGYLILPSDSRYDDARRLWNGSFDRRPALIARCAGAADVVKAVSFARSSGILTAVRSGGHSISGQSVCDGGLVIDLSGMKGIRVDPRNRTATAQAGVLLGELDREAQGFGLITTLGTASDTGIAGLTLGGGLGRLARRYGLTIDNLLSVDIVTASGELLHANARENADLFWAVRGGGGNFGVVTSFEYQLHPFDGRVLAGQVMFAPDPSGSILHTLAQFAEDSPDEMYLNPLFVQTPDGRVAGFEVCYSGPQAEGERLLAPLRKLGKPLVDVLVPTTYLDVQTGLDSSLRQHRSYYFKSGFLTRVSLEMARELTRVLGDAPPWLLGVPLIHMGGAISRVKPEATAFWNREAFHDIAIWAVWDDRADNDRNVAAVRNLWRDLEPLTRGYYINTDTPDDERRLRDTYGGNYERLVTLKTKYDPANLFRLNANIKPRAAPLPR
jgi:FAD/FMN-containing dehydrogenase